MMNYKDVLLKGYNMKPTPIINQATGPKNVKGRSTHWLSTGLCILGCIIALPSEASKLTYQPINPTFGGNYLNTTHLFSRAEAINDYEGDSSSSSTSAVDSLVSSLQSRLLSQLISSGETGSLVTDDYTLNITDDGDGGLTLSIIDAVTGETTTIQVSGLN